eukprot:g59164.t1
MKGARPRRDTPKRAHMPKAPSDWLSALHRAFFLSSAARPTALCTSLLNTPFRTCPTRVHSNCPFTFKAWR